MRRYRQDVLGIMKGYLLSEEGFYMYVSGRADFERKKIYIPIKHTGGEPQVPNSIRVGDHIAILHGTNPIAYRLIGTPKEAEEAN